MKLALILALLLTACSVIPLSPEASIADGANSVTAATTGASVILKNGKITKTQAQGYSGLLHAAAGHLDDANKRLVTCRAQTGSSAKSNPDPCKPTVMDDINLGLSVVADVKKAIDAKTSP